MENRYTMVHYNYISRLAAWFLGSLTLGILLPLSLSFANAQSISDQFGVEKIHQSLPNSWSLNFSPDNRMFITERNGALLVEQADNTFMRYTFPINDLYRKGQGGFMDIAFHPQFSTAKSDKADNRTGKGELKNQWIYMSYSFGSDDANGLKIIRFQLPKVGTLVSQVELIFEQESLRDTPVHYGGRLLFDPQHYLYITTGDGFDYREQAQVKHSQLGKTLRMTDTGAAVETNPLYEPNSNAQSYVFTLGHRNPQALIGIERQGEFVLIGHEHGPDGGDEVNLLTKGNNYGWPVITDGKDYSGAAITPFKQYEGMQQPNYNWTPSIAPSGMVYYDGDSFVALKNHLLITALKTRDLRALAIKGDTIGGEVILLSDLNTRLRDIAIDNTGDVYLLTDGVLDPKTKQISAEVLKLVLK